MNILLRFIVPPWTPWGRKDRIGHLEKLIHEERDICAAIVYSRDMLRGFHLSTRETIDLTRINQRLTRGEIVMPADRR